MKRHYLWLHNDDSMAETALKKTLTEETDKRWELRRNSETSVYIQSPVLDPEYKSLSSR